MEDIWIADGRRLLAWRADGNPSARTELRMDNRHEWNNVEGKTWREKIEPPEYAPPSHGGYILRGAVLDVSNDKSIAEIVVPEHAIISNIDVRGCVNLTNIVIQPDIPRTRTIDGQVREQDDRGRDLEFHIRAAFSGLSNITCSKTMRGRLWVHRGKDWWAIQWTELEPEPPRIEIKTHAAANGKEMEIVWGDGTLQIADAVNGQWRDHFGVSPLRFPIATDSAMFFRIKRNR